MGDLLRVGEVATQLGVSRWVVYELVRRGVLPGAVRVGRRVLLRRPVLEAWLRGEDAAAGVELGRAGSRTQVEHPEEGGAPNG